MAGETPHRTYPGKVWPELEPVSGYARISPAGWGHRGDELELTVDQAVNLIGKARSGGSKIADPKEWNGGNVSGVLITSDDLKELQRLAGKSGDSGLFGVPFLKEALDIGGTVGGGLLGIPVPVGSLLSAGDAIAQNPTDPGTILNSLMTAGPTALGLTGVELPPSLEEVTHQGASSLPGGGDLMASGGLMDWLGQQIGGKVDDWMTTAGSTIGNIPVVGNVMSAWVNSALQSQFAPVGAAVVEGLTGGVLGGGTGPAASPAASPVTPSIGGSSMNLAEAIGLTGTGRLPRSIPLSALGGTIPHGYHTKRLGHRKAQPERAAGDYAVRNRRTNFLNIRALSRASHRLHGATRIVRHLFTLPHHTIRAKKRKSHGFAHAK